MYRDRLKPKPEFIDYASAAAWLTSMGSSFRGVAEVINRSSAAVVGRWAWVDGAIRPIGPIDFTAVTTTQGATIGSVTGQVLDLSDSTFVVTGGYVLRIWNTTDGALVSDVAAGSWTRSGVGISAGAAVAAAVSALIAGGKSIRCWVEGLSELSIGGASSAIELGAGDTWRFVASGGDAVGRAVHAWAGVWRPVSLLAAVASATALSAANKRLLIGWCRSSTEWVGGGIARNAASAVLSAYEEGNKALTIPASSTVAQPPESIGLSYGGSYAIGSRHHGFGSPMGGSGAGAVNIGLPAAYSTALPYTCADDGAVFSSLSA